MTSQMSRAALRAASHPVVEALEVRRHLSVSFEYGYWRISEGDGNDRIVIRQSKEKPSRIQAVVNGEVAGEVGAGEVYWMSIDAGGGDDDVRFEGDVALSATVNVYGGSGDDTLIGSAVSDSLDGGDGNDLLRGRRGDDQVSGREGDDVFRGGSGNDELGGEGGDDLLNGGNGNDLVAGAEGDDSVGGDAGADTLAGGTGKDEVLGGGDDDQMHGGYDEDTVAGDDGEDTLWGGLGEDVLAGGGGGDTVYHEPGSEAPKWDRWDTRRNEQLVNPMKRMESDGEIKRMLIDEAVRRWQWKLGTSWTPWEQWREYDRDDEGRLVIDNPDAEEPGGSGLLGGVCGGPVGGEEEPPDHSETNTQEQDVDEADVVKTNGQHMFLLQQGELVVLDAWPAEETHIVSRTELEGEPSGLYLIDDRVIVLTREMTEIAYECETEGDIEPGTTCETDDAGWDVTTKVITYDVTDPASPKRVEETSVDGSLGTSRVVDGRLYLVMNGGMNLPAPRSSWHEQPVLPEGWDGEIGEPLSEDAKGQPIYGSGPIERWDGSVRQIKGYYLYETEAAYRKRLEAMTLEELAPGYATRTFGAGGDGNATNSNGSLVKAGTLYVGEDERDQSGSWDMTSVVLMDLKDDVPGVESATSILGKDGIVYASRDSLYIAAQEYETPMGEWEGEYKTDVYKFRLGADSVDLAASGQVPGWVLNQFSMDDEGGEFRIATTNGNWWDTARQSNNVFVLTEDAAERNLGIVGGIVNLAKSERIYSARFIGDKGYLVTFRKVDPLYTLDLSDPANPNIVGELKIPGYSSYLHPVGDDLLLGVGRYADEVEGLAYGLQVSLFDVSDFANPTRVDVETFGQGRWEGESKAEYDHHAFAYFAAQGLMAIPVIQAGAWSEEEPEHSTVIMRVDGEEGLTEIGRVEHETEVWRNVRIGSFLYSLASDRLKVVELADPSKVVADVELPYEPPPPDRWWDIG